MRYVSPTQVEAFDDCNRKWWFGWVKGMKDPDKGFNLLGTALHAVIERYLKADPLEKDLELYPAGWDATITPVDAVLIKALIQKSIDEGVLVRTPGLLIEEEMKIAMMDNVIMVGFIDVLDLQVGIQDHKTAKNFKYAKSPAQLKKSPQMLIYGRWWLEKKMERGEPLPKDFELRHNVYSKDPANEKIRVTRARVTPQEVFNYWQLLLDSTVPAMLEVAKLETWQEVPGPELPAVTCNKYGGCPKISICTLRETITQFAERTNKTKEPKKMSLADKLRRPTPAVSTAAPKINSSPAKAVAPASLPKASPFGKKQPIQVVAQEEVIEEVVELVPEEEGIYAPPWAVPECTACQGSGFSTVGNPCRICDKTRAQAQSITSSMFSVGTDEKNLTWEPLPMHAATLKKLGYIPGDDPGQQRVGDGAAEVNVEEREEAAIEEMEVVEEDQIVDEGGPVAQPARRGPGRPRKTETIDTAITKESFRMFLGCHPRRSKNGAPVYIDELIADLGKELAEATGSPSYYAMDVWKRADALAAVAPEAAKRLQGRTLMVSRLTVDNGKLVEALSAIANEVYEADGFGTKAV